MNSLEVESFGVFGFAVSFICSVIVVATTKWHGKFTLDGTLGVQKQHATPIPRIGGIALLAGLLAVNATAQPDVGELLGPILLAALPAFLFGLAEDLTKRVSVRARLLATMASGILAWILTGHSVTHLGFSPLDGLLAWLPLSVLFTAFAVGGVANAVNIIDGFNGLASGTVAICIGALGVIAHQAGDSALASLCFAICAVVLGFLAVNFPFGKLFMGDGGAYMLGFVMAWLAVMLPARNPSVSPWAAFLACGYPIFETLFTIGRRVWARSHPGQPDSGHLHSLVNVVVSKRMFVGLQPVFSNALVSPFCWMIAALTATFAIKNSTKPTVLMLSTIITFALYVFFYWSVKNAVQQVRAKARPVSLVVVPAANKKAEQFRPVPLEDADDDIVRAQVR